MLVRLPVEVSSIITSTIASVTNPRAIQSILKLLFFKYAKIATNPRKTEMFKLTTWIMIWYIMYLCIIWGMVNGTSREETIIVVSAKNLSLLSSRLWLPCDCTFFNIRMTRFKLIGTALEASVFKYKLYEISVFLFENKLAIVGQSNVRSWRNESQYLFQISKMKTSTCS